MSGVTWTLFAEASPELAAAGRRLLERSGTAEGFLATVRDGTPPRIHPVIVGVVEGRLVTFVIDGSAKERDLLEDGRYALHAHQDPAVPHELLVRGRAVPVADPALGAAAAAAWPFNVVDGGYRLFELGIEHVLLGERPDADAWPPRYRSWRPPSR
ncbi:MAG: hypothetical protein A2V85_02525 [Chloroflexi bacterium RBG_16_72_14]|nr:MAG: hypothetical protein A2V85_02525 [Chloroflexi bacterium RBG_16_72_14]